jgi:hypothetical protein
VKRLVKMSQAARRATQLVLELSVELAAPQGNDSVGAANRPEHAGLLEARTDDGLASGFDDARADKQMLAAKLGVAYALGISLKGHKKERRLFLIIRSHTHL